ncbi:MAG: response regulator [Deltaproteobacteria bacterium]|nr:response regulator [Deltaproteobacteria bacterium]
MINKTIEWVKSTEKAAQRFYEKALKSFGDDRELAVFLRHLAEDEKKHYEMVSGAYGLYGGVSDIPQGIYIDVEAMSRIGTAIRLCEKRLEAGELTKTELIDSIVTIEFSECNEIFLYAITVLKVSPGEFRKAVVEIRKHKVRIEAFLKGKPEYSGYTETIKSLPAPSGESILVVDDEVGMIDVFEAFLSPVGTVESAANGVEALGKINKSPFFSVIVTDVDMPLMGGIELYRKTSERYPALKERFVFLTGTMDPARLLFFRENNLKYFMKPVSIKDIKTAVCDIIEK